MQVVCRDRAGAYAEGIRDGAPDAVQVADRWHLWHNLVEAVEKVVRQHHSDLREPSPVVPDTNTDTHTNTNTITDVQIAPAEPEDTQVGTTSPTRLAARTQQRYAAVQALLAAGTSISAISQTLGVGPQDRAALHPAPARSPNC